MPTIKESAQAYEGESKTRNVVELDKVSTDLVIETKELKARDGTTFVLNYIVIDNEQYRIPDSVLKSLKVILEDNPNLKQFRVKKQGTGMDTSYTVIPLV